MMGIEVIPHDERYQRTEAYVEILKGLWTSPPGTFNQSSRRYHITDGWVSPLPVCRPHPPIANAGVSEDARRMVSRLCDWAFISLRDAREAAPIAADLRERARGYDRTIKVSTYPMIIWADTEKEAEQERKRLIDQLDYVAAENWARGLSGQSGSFDRFTLEMFAIGGGALPVIGTAEQAAEQIAGL
jgi:FMNH2-dependent dimethyl sulfone monooxygenase